MPMRLRTTPLLDSFCGMDLKLGATLVSLFALLNKVAGAYGMLAVVLSGGAALSQPLGQITMYIYSIVSLVGFIWGLQKISEENGDKTLRYAHLFAIDHLVGTVYTTFFAVVWYIYVPHDGKRIANSAAQKAMMGGSQTGIIMDDAARTAAAMGVWQSERVFSAAVLVIGWLLKAYFVAILYSFAQHLRHGTYASLPSSSHNTVPSSKFTSASDPTRGRRYTVSRGATRDSPSGGPQYSHLRGNSLASTAGVGSRGSMDGLDGTETTLAETLWEDSSDRPVEAGPSSSSSSSAPAAGGVGSHARSESTNLAPGSPSNPRRALPRRNSRVKGAPPPLMPTLSSRNSSTNAIPKTGNEPQVPVSPAYAIGTGMTRPQSGSQYTTGGGGGGGGGGVGGQGATTQAEHTREQERTDGVNPFAQILGRISLDESRR
ncbi:hypothetical protein JCM8115_001814 [Rhodotorula mucilaginosa]